MEAAILGARARKYFHPVAATRIKVHKYGIIVI